MKIVLTGQMSGTRNGKSWPPRGTDLDLPGEEAEGLVRSGMAIRADHEKADLVRSGGEVLADEILAGAPEGRDWTDGQHDTNLSRAQFMAQADEDSRKLARDAAERTNLDDAHTIPGADPKEPVVGDGKPNPTDAPVATPPAPVVPDRPKPGK